MPSNPLVVKAFQVYPGYSTTFCSYHYVTVNGVRYCGTGGPDGVTPSNGEMTWTAEAYSFASTYSGWEICFQVHEMYNPCYAHM